MRWGKLLFLEGVDAFLVVIGEAVKPAFIDDAGFFAGGEPLPLFCAEGFALRAGEFG